MEGVMRWRLWVLGMVGSAVVGGLTAAAVVLLVMAPATRAAPDEQGRGQLIPYLQVQRIDLVDETGMMRGQWIAGNRDTELTLHAPDGQVGAWLRVGSDSATFALPPGAGGGTALILNQNPQRADIIVQNIQGSGAGRAAMTLSVDEGPAFKAIDSSARVIWAAP
jgi:hypothetical protein